MRVDSIITVVAEYYEKEMAAKITERHTKTGQRFLQESTLEGFHEDLKKEARKLFKENIAFFEASNAAIAKHVETNARAVMNSFKDNIAAAYLRLHRKNVTSEGGEKERVQVLEMVKKDAEDQAIPEKASFERRVVAAREARVLADQAKVALQKARKTPFWKWRFADFFKSSSLPAASD